MFTVLALVGAVSISAQNVPQQSARVRDYKLLATNRTSTMQKELNEAASNGYRFERAMGGATGFGGKEVVAIVSRSAEGVRGQRYEYRLLATQRTSTMQKELQEAGDAGFEYRDQSVFESAFGGEEVVVIVEKDRDAPTRRYEYKLLATNKTSTMQKEVQETAEAGFEFVGVTVSKTTYGGNEVVTIMRRVAPR
jgi:hypothetical protein